MENERDFKIKIQTEGAEEAVDAQKRLAEAQGNAADAGRKSEDQQKNAELRMASLTQLLGRIDPQLAAAAQSAKSFADILEALGDNAITVDGLIGALSDGVKKYSGAIMTLGAAGAAAAAIGFMISQWQKLGEEMKKVEEQQKAFNKLQDEQAARRQSGREAVISAAIGRGEAPTREQLDRAEQLVAGVASRGVVDPGDAAKAIGAVLDRIQSLSPEDIELLTLLMLGGSDISRPVSSRAMRTATAQLETLIGERSRNGNLSSSGRAVFVAEELRRRGVSEESIEAATNLNDEQRRILDRLLRRDFDEYDTPTLDTLTFYGAGGGSVETEENLLLAFSRLTGLSIAEISALLATLRSRAGGNVSITVNHNPRFQGGGAAAEVMTNGDRRAEDREG